jgi:hypothetical protein
MSAAGFTKYIYAQSAAVRPCLHLPQSLLHVCKISNKLQESLSLSSTLHAHKSMELDKVRWDHR